MNNPKETAEKILVPSQRVEWANIENLAHAYLDAAKELENTKMALSELESEIINMKEENVRLKIDYQALENSNRKLNEANERIVEFDSIKKSHLATIEKLKEEVDNLSEQECMNCGAWLVQSNVLEKYSNKMIDELKSEITKLKEENERLNEEVKFFPSLTEQRNLHEQVAKLKKSREVLRTAVEFYGTINTKVTQVDEQRIVETDNLFFDVGQIIRLTKTIDTGETAREALKADDEIMGGE